MQHSLYNKKIKETVQLRQKIIRQIEKTKKKCQKVKILKKKDLILDIYIYIATHRQ